MIPTHELISNPSFTGLKMSNLTSLQHYAHLRDPVHPEKKILIGRTFFIQNAINAWREMISSIPLTKIL